MSSHRPRLLAVTALTVGAALTLSACGSDTPTSQDTTTATSSPASGGATSATVSSAAPAPAPMALAQGLTGADGDATARTPGSPADTAPKAAASASETASDRAALTLTAIRVGEHETKDRVVFEFGGTGTPGYSVAYVDAPAQQGSGRRLDVPGQTFLQVSMTGQALPMATGLTEVPPGTQQAQGVDGVAGVTFGGQFEGTAQAVVGLTGPQRPFTAFLLENPTRLVVDLDG